jgi:hypothetical protein
MRVGLFLMVVACGSLAACGGQVLTQGSCSLVIMAAGGGAGVGSLWLCSPDEPAGQRSYPSLGINLSQCQTGTAAGGSCQQDETVQTTNTTLPATITGPAPNCFDCSGGGTGTEWTCGSGGWEAAGVYSCQ